MKERIIKEEVRIEKENLDCYYINIDNKRKIIDENKELLLSLIPLKLDDYKNSKLRLKIRNDFNLYSDIDEMMDKNGRIPKLFDLDNGWLFIGCKKSYINKYTYNDIHNGLKYLLDYIDGLNYNNDTCNIDTFYVPLELFGLEDKLDTKHIIKKFKKTFNCKNIEIIFLEKINLDFYDKENK